MMLKWCSLIVDGLIVVMAILRVIYIAQADINMQTVFVGPVLAHTGLILFIVTLLFLANIVVLGIAALKKRPYTRQLVNRFLASVVVFVTTMFVTGRYVHHILYG